MSERRPKTRSTAESDDAALREGFADLCRLPLNLGLGSYHAQAVYWGLINRAWWRNYEHAHSFFEVCYCYAGGGTFELEGQVHQVNEGDLFIARPGQVHEIISGKKKPMCIHFWAFTLVREAADPTKGDKRLDTILSAFAEAQKKVLRPGPAIDAILLDLCREIRDRRPGYQTVIRGLAERLILQVARDGCGLSLTAEELPMLSPHVGDPVVSDTIRYIRYHLASRLEIADIAAQVNLSERHLTRLFRQQMGKSVLEFITAERLALACQLLVERKLSVKQVARAVGYPDAHYFTTLFGRKFGKTPTEFREAGGTRFVSGESKVESGELRIGRER
jgi:AraC family L-rhamnose operon transcriptional activator RhaR